MALSMRFSRKDSMIHARLLEADLQPDQVIVDYGAGPGFYTIPVAKLIGSKGIVYAVDIHPLASKYIKKKADKHNLINIKTIITDCQTHLDNNTVDRVLLFDVLHHLQEIKSHLLEFKRILKSDGKLVLAVDHYDLEKSSHLIEETKIFRLEKITQHVAVFIL